MIKKIRIMHVAQSSGGVARYIQMLLKYLDKSMFENILIASHDYNKDDFCNLVNFFEQINMNRSICVNDIKAITGVRRLIKKYKPDIIYAHSSKAGAVTRIADLGIYNKCIYNPHGWSFNMRCSKKKQIVYSTIEKMLAPLADFIVCISEAEKKSALDKKICLDKKIQVIINGVDIEQLQFNKGRVITRKELKIPYDAFIIGMVGRISKQKAPDIFMKVAKEIKKTIKNSYFIIVGNGEQQNEVENYAKKYGLSDSLLITGWVDSPLSYVDLFDVAMLLSRWEGFGLVLPEYMIAGKPIVATRVDAIPEIITHYKNGLLIEVDNVGAACKSVMELYNRQNLRVNLVNQGYIDVVEKFNARRVAVEHQELFKKLVVNVM